MILEESDLGAYCLQYWQPKYINIHDRADGNCPELLEKGKRKYLIYLAQI